MKKIYAVGVLLLGLIFICYALVCLVRRLDWDGNQANRMIKALKNPYVEAQIHKWVHESIGYLPVAPVSKGQQEFHEEEHIGGRGFDWSILGVMPANFKVMKIRYELGGDGWNRVDFGASRVGVSVSYNNQFGRIDPFVIYKTKDGRVVVYLRRD